MSFQYFHRTIFHLFINFAFIVFFSLIRYIENLFKLYMLNIILYLYMKYLFFYYMYPYQTIIIFIFVTHQEVIQISYSSSQLIQSVPEPPRICSGYLHPHAAHTNPFSFVTIQLSHNGFPSLSL